MISPNDIKILKENQQITFTCNVYNEGEILSDIVTCTPTGVDSKCYELTNYDNKYTLKAKRRSSAPLILTFSAADCADYIMNINLIGLL